jgi:hypothetical protein
LELEVAVVGGLRFAHATRPVVVVVVVVVGCSWKFSPGVVAAGAIGTV